MSLGINGNQNNIPYRNEAYSQAKLQRYHQKHSGDLRNVYSTSAMFEARDQRMRNLGYDPAQVQQAIWEAKQMAPYQQAAVDQASASGLVDTIGGIVNTIKGIFS